MQGADKSRMDKKSDICRNVWNNKRSSDIDVLVEYSRRITLFDIARMQIELTEELDLVDKEGVYPSIMKYILRDLKTVCYT
jgi:predicted nucleotidyltransferase